MQSHQTATAAWSKNSRRKTCRLCFPEKSYQEGACMKYVNAKTILPASLVRELQQYIQGGYIYVPAGDDRKKRWGEISGYRQELQHRNREITEKYRRGVSVEFLAEKYSLSLSAVRKIIYQK